MFKTLPEAVKAVGGEENAIAIITRYVKHAMKQKEDRALVAWLRKQGGDKVKQTLAAAKSAE